jgi:hypothetical protein
MGAWHRSGTADFGFRIIGLLLCVASYLAVSHLIAIQPPLPDQAVNAESFFLSTIGFLGASAGSAMTCLGNHLFDQVEVSVRWGTGRLIPLEDAPQLHGSTDSDGNGTRLCNAGLGQAG